MKRKDIAVHLLEDIETNLNSIVNSLEKGIVTNSTLLDLLSTQQKLTHRLKEVISLEHD